MSPTRPSRLRRALAAASAAAVVVVVTACGVAAASTGDDERGRSPEAVAAGLPDDGHAHSHGHDVVPLAGSRSDNEKNDGEKNDGEKQEDDGQKQEDDGQKQEKDKEKDKLDILGTDCNDSDLQRHDGFQKAPRCVQTSFGEVAAADRNPSLLITKAPRRVTASQPFALVVSTRNLVRDRFLGAAVGGYYAESSFLNEEGIQRGHFHTACRMLASTDQAPDPAPEPAFFLATQDNGGGAGEDKVTIDVPGLTQRGTAQCAVWAGDGSHRIPMMERASQTPAFDAVRIEIQ